jgi:hypothetical protein
MGLYGLQFEGINGIREEMVRVKALEDGLTREAISLAGHANALLGYGKPLAMRRVRNKSYAPLVWRDMTVVRNRQGIVPEGLAGELGKRVKDSLPEIVWRRLLDIEQKRVHLNHALGMTQYELARLKRLEGEFDVWRRMMRDLKAQ